MKDVSQATEKLVESLEFRVVSVDHAMAQLAVEGHRRFTGNDFSQTDIASVL
jgi:uncharacterized protein with PIN domain